MAMTLQELKQTVEDPKGDVQGWQGYLMCKKYTLILLLELTLSLYVNVLVAEGCQRRVAVWRC